MKICIVGSNGRMGQMRKEHLIDRGHEVVGVDIDNQDADIFQGLFRYALSIQTQGKLL